MTVTTRRPLALGRAGWRYSLRRWKQRGHVRCRLVASWGWSRSQGLGCSPIKAVRELGLERRETVREIAVYKSGQMLENPVHPSLPKNGKNVQGADNQQERLDGQSPSGIPRDCTPDGSDPEDTVRAAWRHAEPSRNDSAGDQ